MINFHELYTKYAKDVYKFIYWLSGNEQDAQDITSETFMRAILNKNSIKIHTVKAYLLTIARNLYLQKVRRKNKNVSIDENMQDKNATADKVIEAKSELKVTLKAIQNLPEPDRSILIMHTQNNLTYPEIAASTGLSIPAIKIKVYRSRLKIKKYLSEDIK